SKKSNSKNEYDIIIVGAGPAGIAAGIYTARQKLKTLMITKDIGGQLSLTASIENWPGIKSISGYGLLKTFEDHLKQYDLALENGEVLDIGKNGKGFVVKTPDKTFFCRAVIVTAGRISRKLNVPGENKYLGKGVSSCGTCDAPLFNGKEVAVAGTGNTAMNVVLLLSRYAKKINLISKYDKLKGDKVVVDRINDLKKKGKIEIFYSSKTLEIMGDDENPGFCHAGKRSISQHKFVNAIKIEHNGKEKILKVDGIFVEIGMTPETEFADVKKNEKGEIIVNNNCETDVKGIFAAGDCTDVPYKQIIISSGEGAKAALSASKYIDSLD
ncbi:MAG: FAD-dependent oxidoreductase, partial [Nanoarchaeota archaeon]|nr:FAD-dependent oxidoreductase [Nanoarchaeota archaeon]